LRRDDVGWCGLMGHASHSFRKRWAGPAGSVHSLDGPHARSRTGIIHGSLREEVMQG